MQQVRPAVGFGRRVSSRRAIVLGSCASGLASVLLLSAAPAVASGTATPSLVAPLLTQALPDAARYRADGQPRLLVPVLPQDLTVHRSPISGGTPAFAFPHPFVGAIARSGHAAAMTGVMSAAPRDLTLRPAAVNDVYVKESDVTTHGANHPAISTTSTGDTRIIAGSLATYGDNSQGVLATGTGDIDVSVQHTYTQGTGSTGIYAHSSNGAVTIDGGESIITEGQLSQGINASGSAVTITAGAIDTHGSRSIGILAYGVGDGATVDITNTGRVLTYGSVSGGIIAVSDGSIAIHDQGSIVTVGAPMAGAPLPGMAPGIRATAVGDVTIDGGGTVATYGSFSPAVDAYSKSGSISIDLGSVRSGSGPFTRGSAGIVAQTSYYDPYTGVTRIGGPIDIKVDDLLTASGLSTGIAAQGKSVDITIGNSLKTYGNGSEGIIARSYAGDIAIHDNGSIETFGAGSTAIDAVAIGDIVIDGGGSVSATAQGSSAIHAYSRGGAISIHTGDVAAASTGVYAVAAGAAPGDAPTKGIDIDVGNVVTTLSGASSSGIVAIDANPYASTTVHQAGVSTNGDYALGIYAFANNGKVTVTGGAVSTHGLDAPGIVAATSSDAVVDVASVATAGYLSSGIIVSNPAISNYAANGTLSVNAGSVSTQGNKSYGMIVEAQSGNVAIDVGSVATQGRQSTGIYASSTGFGMPASLTVKAGTVATTGDASYGIRAEAISDTSTHLAITSTGSVSTKGAEAPGIVAIAYAPLHSVLTIGAHDVSTGGENSIGVVAYNAGQGGTVLNASGTIATSGDTSLGAYVRGQSNIAVDIANITTSGSGAGTKGAPSSGGLYVMDYARNPAHTLANSVDVHVGSVTTSGSYSNGVQVGSYAETNSIAIGTAKTSGNYSAGVVVQAIAGNADVTIDQLSTSGAAADGLDVLANDAATVKLGSVSTTGAGSKGAQVVAFGPVSVTSTGTISTTGDYSTGIVAFAGLTVFGDFHGNLPPLPDPATLAVNANIVTTTGANAMGIFARNDNPYGKGDVSVTAASVSTIGDGSTGIMAIAPNDVTVNVGSVTTGAANAIYAQSSGTGSVSIGVTGKVLSSGADAIVVSNADGTTGVTVASGGSVTGAGDALRLESGGTHAVTVANAGTIAGGSGYAVELTGLPVTADDGTIGTPAATAAATIANTGTIAGAIRLGTGDDTLTNGGTFVATKDSDFGDGDDLFVNSGMLSVQPGARPGAVTLAGLESFRNTGGIVDLRNGVAGDTLTLPGGYVGSGDARLGLDLIGGTADRLVVGGAATGSTSLLINGAASTATLLARPVLVVQAGAGTSADAFALADQNVGFIAYGLEFDAGSDSFSLTAAPGGEVYRLAKIDEAAQSIWRQSADAWSTHMAELRDTGQPASRVWGQAYGKVDKRDERRSVGANSYDLGYRQDYYGGEAGLDLAGRRSDAGDGFVLGAMAGYLSSHMNFRASTARVRFDTVNVGGYGSLRAGPLFVNLLGQYDHYRIHADDAAAGWLDRFDGKSYGAQAELGARFGSGRFFAEPLASIAWQRTNLDTLHAFGQGLDFDRDTGLTGKAGGRIGGTFDLGKGASAVFYARAAYVHEFKGRGGLLFESGGTDAAIAGSRIGDHGEGAVGMNILTAGRLSGFLEADGDAGGSFTGGGGRVGIRFKL